MAHHGTKLKSHEPRGILTTWEHLLAPIIMETDDCGDSDYKPGL